MWELYDKLLAGLPRTGTVTRATAGERWTLVETDLGGAGHAMTTEGDSFPPRYPNGIEGMRIRVAAEAVKSWAERCLLTEKPHRSGAGRRSG